MYNFLVSLKHPIFLVRIYELPYETSTDPGDTHVCLTVPFIILTTVIRVVFLVFSVRVK